MAEPTLYSFRRCPYAMRARMALLVSGTVVEVREVALADKPDAMMRASPKGTVPVLVLPNAGVLEESIDIMRWALRQHDPEGWLENDDAALIAANDGAFKHHLDRYKYADRYHCDPVEHRAAAVAMLGMLEERLVRQRFLCGARQSLADAALMPFVRQFAATDQAWFDAQPLHAVQRWLAAQLASPLFERAMIRRPVWRPGDPAAALQGTVATVTMKADGVIR